jgi:hypothetical protein
MTTNYRSAAQLSNKLLRGILRTHANATIYLDKNSASLLSSTPQS